MVLFSANEQNVVTLPHSVQRKRAFLVKTMEKSKSQKKIIEGGFSLKLLHHRLRHSSTISLMDEYNANVW